MTPVIPISIITGVAFLGMLIYLLYALNEIQYPKGAYRVFLSDGVRVTVIFDRKLGLSDGMIDAHMGRTMLAVSAVQVLWEYVSRPQRAMRIKHTRIVIHVTSEVHHRLRGVQTYARAKLGSKTEPMLVIEGSLYPERTASLVIHEATHLFAASHYGAPNTDENDPHLWAELSPTSFEARAQQRYAELSA